MADLIDVAGIRDRILHLRGHRVILDTDLAVLYGVSRKRLLEQVRRNPDRLPVDFCFQLTRQEVASLRTQIAAAKKGRGGRRTLPYAFTEHGALMASTILNSPQAIQMSLAIIRVFVRLRELLADHKALAAKLNELEGRLGAHDEQIAAIIAAIRQLTTPPPVAPKPKIGFHPGNR